MYAVRVCIFLFNLKRSGDFMRHGTSGRRRGRGGGRRNNNQRMQVFDSNGPDVRIRGTAHQVAEKYQALAKDATSAGDDILAESYLQHAEHYVRIIGSWDVQSNAKGESKSEDKPVEEKASEDDLSLPSSILGEAAKVDAKERTAEVAAG